LFLIYNQKYDYASSISYIDFVCAYAAGSRNCMWISMKQSAVY